ncbi:hypothetical protein Droror1_Dr00023584 [Drosera rotundifolia]
MRQAAVGGFRRTMIGVPWFIMLLSMVFEVVVVCGFEVVVELSALELIIFMLEKPLMKASMSPSKETKGTGSDSTYSSPFCLHNLVWIMHRMGLKSTGTNVFNGGFD